MDIILYILIGCAVATLGTLIGAGGGIIFVPLFMYMFPDWSPTTIIGTSLFIVMCNAISGSVAYVKQKKILYKAAIIFSLATFPGSIIGALWSNYFNGASFRFYFGLVLFVVSILIFYKNRNRGQVRPGEDIRMEDVTYNTSLGVAVSIVVGFISSTFGIGGGVIHVPALVYLLAFPTHIATATSHFILAISTIVGVGMHLWEHHINFTVAIACSIGAIVGAQIGARLSKKVKATVILLLLAGALLLLAVRLMYTSHFLG